MIGASQGMGEIILRPSRPFDFDEEELDSLAREFREQLGAEVLIESPPEQRGYGVTWWEVLGITLSLVQALHQVVPALVNWARNRRKDHGKRLLQVSIYGPKGELLKEVKVDSDGNLMD